jgi:hypothetical protein
MSVLLEKHESGSFEWKHRPNRFHSTNVKFAMGRELLIEAIGPVAQRSPRVVSFAKRDLKWVRAFWHG